MVSNKKIIFAEYAPALPADKANMIIPTEIPVAGKHIQVKEDTIDLDAELPEGDILLKTLEISIDPYMVSRFRAPDVPSYSPAFTLHETISDDTMSVVLKSKNPNYKVGDLVYGRNGYGLMQEYVQVNAEYADQFYVVRNDPKENGLSLAHYVGALGMSGMTAFVG
jgi:NADPH-dependent curcumin reductase CurA